MIIGDSGLHFGFQNAKQSRPLVLGYSPSLPLLPLTPQTFIYVLCSMGLRSNFQRLFGTTPPKNAGGGLFGMPMPQPGSKPW